MKRSDLICFALVFVLAICVAELALYSFAAQDFSPFGLHPFFNVGRIDHFIDLQVVTLNGYGCDSSIELIYDKSCYSIPTNIPRFFIQAARLLHVGSQNTRAVGFIVGSASVGLLVSIYTYSLKKMQAFCAAVIVIIGFPYRLALERGNIDLIVLSLLLGAVFFLSKTDSKHNIKSILNVFMSVLFVAAAVLGKVYPVLVLPVIVLVILAAHCLSSLEKIFLVSFASALLIGSVVSVLPDLPHMTGSSYRELAGGMGYGLMTSPDRYLGGFFTVLFKFVIAAFVAVFAIFDSHDFFAVRGSAKELVTLFRSSPRHRLIAIAFLFGASLFLGTYLVFVNGIYRLSVPLSLLAPWFIYWLFTSYKDLISYSQGGFCLMLSFLAIEIVGYRPYLDGSNLQHLTQIFVEFCLYPLASGYLMSVLIAFIVVLTRKEGCRFLLQ